MEHIKGILEFSEETWYEKKGLAIALFAATIAGLALFPNQDALYAIGATIFIDLCLIAVWLQTRYLPKAPRDKLGFLVCIHCADDTEVKKFREDFIIPLRQLVKSGQTGEKFHFIEVPQHIARRTEDLEAAQELRIRTRAHFMIHGRIRLREINKKKTHVLEMQSIVAHQPILDTHTQQAFAREFTELMPSRLHVEVENDALSFEFSSQWTSIVSQYVISLAAALSGDDGYAETLLIDAKSKLQGQNTRFPIYSQLKHRIPLRISSIYQSRAKVAYKNWAETRNSDYLRELEGHLAKLASQHAELPATQNLFAIVAFGLHKNPRQALSHVKAMKGIHRAIWQLNMAFLHSYMGQLTTAIRHYRLAIAEDPDTTAVAEVESFIEWVLAEEPEKIQLYYCLGFFNWKLKGDYIQAAKDISHFLEKAGSSFVKEQTLATKWLAEIKLSPQYQVAP